MNRRLFLYGWSPPCFGSWGEWLEVAEWVAVGGCRGQVAVGFVVGCRDCFFSKVASCILSVASLIFILRSSLNAHSRLTPLPIKRTADRMLLVRSTDVVSLSRISGVAPLAVALFAWNFGPERQSAMPCRLWYRSLRRNIYLPTDRLPMCIWTVPIGRLFVAGSAPIGDKLVQGGGRPILGTPFSPQLSVYFITI